MSMNIGGQTYTDDQIKNFFASNPSNDAIAKQAASMGLSADQVAQAANIAGKSWTSNDVTSWAGQNGYGFNKQGAAMKMPALDNPNGGYVVNPGNLGSTFFGYNGKAYSTSVPTGDSFVGSNGQTYTKQQIQDWYNQINPKTGKANKESFGADIEMMAQLGLKAPDVYKARYYAGLGDGNGIYTDPAEMNAYHNYADAHGYALGNMPDAFDVWRSKQNANYLSSLQKDFDDGNIGYSGGPQGGFKLNKPAYVGLGANYHPGPDGETPTGNGIINSYMTGSPSGGVTGATGSSGANYIPGPNGNTPSGSNYYANGGTSPGMVNVTPDQLTSYQLNKVIDPNSAPMQLAATSALESMNDRGIINSSIAQTAGQKAMYDLGLQIAARDAQTYADAAKTNAGSQTSWAIAQNNNATSLKNTDMQIQAQKELAHASQLYSNLASQTATANSIQSWGLNTISSIMSSDLSADAKTAAINQIKQWLADSYQIQGDWHTSAAKAIDAIFGVK